MWSIEDDAFIASVLELPKCQAKGKTVVEAMNHLEAAIEEWIETAKKMGQAIPEPFYYEPEDFTEVQEEEKVPYYDSVSKTWKVATEWRREEGDALYIASEFVKGGLTYPFYSEPSWKERHHDHEHEFSSVVSFLLGQPSFFSIAGFEEFYSQQEQELLYKLVTKLHIPNEETIE